MTTLLTEHAPAPTASELRALLNEIRPDDMPEEFKCVDEGVWEDEGKYSSRYMVFEHLPSGTYWGVAISRHGSYWTDYETYIEDVDQVKKTTKVVTEWSVI